MRIRIVKVILYLMKETNLDNYYYSMRYNTDLKRVSLLFLFLFCLIFVSSCGSGETTEGQERIVIDAAYVTSTSTTFPPVPYPIEIEDEFQIGVGELFGYEAVNWQSLFPWDYSISNPQIVAGEGTVCEIAADTFSVLAKSPGSCDVKYPSENSGVKGFIFLTLTVTEG